MSVEWGPWLDRLLGTPLQVLGIVIGALVLRWLLHRLIRKVVTEAIARHESREPLDRGRAR